VAGGITLVVGAALRRRPPGGGQRWSRRNYRDRQVSLLLGPAVAAGALAGASVAGGRPGVAAVLVAGCAATVGGYDDLRGDTHARGLAGHGRALAAGRLTSGHVKAASIVTSAVAASIISPGGGAVDVLTNAVLGAGSANLVNLFDLRPGRAQKVVLLGALPLWLTGGGASARLAAAAAGTCMAGASPDLGERGMLGDCGAGALGALLGTACAQLSGRRVRRTVAAGVVGLTLASERVSFSAVIERTPALAAADRWGRAGR
jgi:hypothetical protein